MTAEQIKARAQEIADAINAIPDDTAWREVRRALSLAENLVLDAANLGEPIAEPAGAE